MEYVALAVLVTINALAFFVLVCAVDAVRTMKRGVARPEETNR